jgi:hypothetical protein
MSLGEGWLERAAAAAAAAARYAIAESTERLTPLVGQCFEHIVEYEKGALSVDIEKATAQGSSWIDKDLITFPPGTFKLPKERDMLVSMIEADIRWQELHKRHPALAFSLRAFFKDTELSVAQSELCIQLVVRART